MLRDWLDETHSAGFELRRHFFLRFFDSELISDPSQAKVAAGGALGILVSISVLFSQGYYHKYRALQALDSFVPYRHAVLADVLFIITGVMMVSALFTVVQWPALFPGLRDYLALAALPVRMGEMFLAKFSALFAAAVVMMIVATFPPGAMVPAMMAGRYDNGNAWHVPGILVAGLLGGLFVFFSLVALQGVLLNLLPVSQFPRISLAFQGFLLALLLGATPFVFSIPTLSNHMEERPPWSMYAPPLWFFGIDQVIFGTRDPATQRLAWRAIIAVLLSAAAAIAAYMWSYRRHRVRVLESPSVESAGARVYWPEALSARLLPGERALGVFGFIAKNLARSRQHRLILTAFAGISLAFISEGFASLILAGGGIRSISASTEGTRESVIAVPLALSLFLITGLRYLFRLPVELRANWLFRMVEPGHANELLAGVERFFVFWGAIPVAVLALPIEAGSLGLRAGTEATVACFLISGVLIEVLLFSFEKVPFTSSYLPGRRPMIETLFRFAIPAVLYIWGLAGVVSFSMKTYTGSLIFDGILAAAWWGLHRARLGSRQIARLEFEEGMPPAVQSLGIERE